MNASATAPAGQPLASADFSVDGLRCAGCIAKLEHGLMAVPGIAAARVNFAAKRLHVAHDATLDDDAVIVAVKRIGFEAHLLAEKIGRAHV